MESDGTKRAERTGDRHKESGNLSRNREHANREAGNRSRRADDRTDPSESDRDEFYVSDVIPLDLKSRMVVVHDNLGRLLKEAIPENEAWDNLGARPSESMLKTLETFSRMCYFLGKEFYDLEQELEKELREPRLDFANDSESSRVDSSRRDARYDARRNSRRDTNRRDTQRSRESRRWSSQANTRVGQYL